MDESWRMRMGMPTPISPPRRSTGDDTISYLAHDPFNPQHFTDVFGGPPRTILSRQFSANYPRSSSSSSSIPFFHQDVFRQQEKAPPPLLSRSGRSLPQFSIPSGKKWSGERINHRNRQNDAFYNDVFGWDDESVVRSRSRSKTSSSSALSSEELSPLRPAVSDDGYDSISLFASKLRPINVRSKRNSTRMGHENYPTQQQLPAPICISEIDFFENFRSYSFRSSRRNASPESINVEPLSNSSFRVSADDLQFNSPSSAVSSICQSDKEMKMNTCETEHEVLKKGTLGQDLEDESVSSYVIEINSDNREWTCESSDVDEAIAWAKEKFQTHFSEEKPIEEILKGHQLSERTESFKSMVEQREEWAAEEETNKIGAEMQLLDEKIRLWSTGKEADIRLLLSSLHHILWPNSGWLAIPLMNIIDSSQVKLAYQKAQLCLNPDKLQERGATLPEKYIAEKVFSALQDAWAAFISQDVFCH
ncbi:J domain-containing protein required for chloroplast accumulation response 1 [Sesamum alatum]|uniref:J domain-containing protein required for chloroplast accumulation response 1 n=1 Tax=Sesamum alatum TaxID=300844 RepID=A0AAE1XZU1_9LAMI|nr:J domain-containing protein required for chloroplast accumulation response 1 [Sesamum alatum]